MSSKTTICDALLERLGAQWPADPSQPQSRISLMNAWITTRKTQRSQSGSSSTQDTPAVESGPASVDDLAPSLLPSAPAPFLAEPGQMDSVFGTQEHFFEDPDGMDSALPNPRKLANADKLQRTMDENHTQSCNLLACIISKTDLLLLPGAPLSESQLKEQRSDLVDAAADIVDFVIFEGNHIRGSQNDWFSPGNWTPANWQLSAELGQRVAEVIDGASFRPSYTPIAPGLVGDKIQDPILKKELSSSPLLGPRLVGLSRVYQLSDSTVFQRGMSVASHASYMDLLLIAAQQLVEEAVREYERATTEENNEILAVRQEEFFWIVVVWCTIQPWSFVRHELNGPLQSAMNVE